MMMNIILWPNAGDNGKVLDSMTFYTKHSNPYEGQERKK